MPQRDGQSGPAAGTPALDRPDWYAERLASIGDREALYVDQHDGAALVDRELTEGFFHDHPELPFGDPVPGVGGLEGLLFAQRHTGPRGPATGKVQASVDDDAVQPRGDRGLAAE